MVGIDVTFHLVVFLYLLYIHWGCLILISFGRNFEGDEGIRNESKSLEFIVMLHLHNSWTEMSITWLCCWFLWFKINVGKWKKIIKMRVSCICVLTTRTRMLICTFTFSLYFQIKVTDVKLTKFYFHYLTYSSVKLCNYFPAFESRRGLTNRFRWFGCNSLI